MHSRMGRKRKYICGDQAKDQRQFLKSQVDWKPVQTWVGSWHRQHTHTTNCLAGVQVSKMCRSVIEQSSGSVSASKRRLPWDSSGGSGHEPEEPAFGWPRVRCFHATNKASGNFKALGSRWDTEALHLYGSTLSLADWWVQLPLRTTRRSHSTTPPFPTLWRLFCLYKVVHKLVKLDQKSLFWSTDSPKPRYFISSSRYYYYFLREHIWEYILNLRNNS